MRLGFRHLTIEAFKSIDKLSLRLDQKAGLHFLKGINRVEPRLGSNGAGKSSIFDALTWVLWGRTVRGLRSPDVQPWGRSKLKPFVGLSLSVDGKVHKLAREGTQSFLDDQPVAGEVVADLLEMNYDLFVNTVVLGQGQPLFFDLPPREKMQLFTDVLQLERWDRRSTFAGKRAGQVERELADISGRLAATDEQLARLDKEIEVAKACVAEWEEERNAALKLLNKEAKDAERRAKAAEDRAAAT